MEGHQGVLCPEEGLVSGCSAGNCPLHPAQSTVAKARERRGLLLTQVLLSWGVCLCVIKRHGLQSPGSHMASAPRLAEEQWLSLLQKRGSVSPDRHQRTSHVLGIKCKPCQGSQGPTGWPPGCPPHLDPSPGPVSVTQFFLASLASACLCPTGFLCPPPIPSPASSRPRDVSTVRGHGRPPALPCFSQPLACFSPTRTEPCSLGLPRVLPLSIC